MTLKQNRGVLCIFKVRDNYTWWMFQYPNQLWLQTMLILIIMNLIGRTFTCIGQWPLLIVVETKQFGSLGAIMSLQYNANVIQIQNVCKTNTIQIQYKYNANTKQAWSLGALIPLRAQTTPHQTGGRLSPNRSPVYVSVCRNTQTQTHVFVLYLYLCCICICVVFVLHLY